VASYVSSRFPIDIQLLAPNEPHLLTEIDDLLEEALEDVDSEALADAGQTGKIRQILVERVPHIPAVGYIEADHLDQFSFRANALKEHDELQLEIPTGSMEGRPRSAYRSCTHSRTNERSNAVSRRR
jgi:hypothetical protein